MQLNSSTIVSCEWLFQNLNLENLIILDASTNNLNECIPNSIHFDLKNTFRDLNSEFPNTIPSKYQFQKGARALGINNDSQIVVYDNEGIYWSPRVWCLFKLFGFENIVVLDGGLPEWKSHLYNITNVFSNNSETHGNFTCKESLSLNFIKLNDVLKIQNDGDYVIIDARSEDRYKSLVPEPRKGLRSGRILNAKNLHYAKLLNGNIFKSKDDLKLLIDSIDIENKSIVFYCGSGITACIVTLAASICDYNKLSVYDGSWTEYGTLCESNKN